MVNLTSYLLFAETRMSDVNLDYKEAAAATGDSSQWILIAAAIVVGSSLAAYLIRRRILNNAHSSASLFGDLCHAHRINGKGCKLLQAIADEASLQQPAMLFLADHHFDSALATAKQTMTLKPDQLATIAMVRRRMFSS
ncbi:LPXTG cell wall anchor domain-containing protein [Novipirellula caenicola]|uniref:Tetratricopeptide repeat protein n=1 Tax=Novipirellula caenicola TaxID=1536901 RepID=A0ABP9VSJ3_9BACT